MKELYRLFLKSKGVNKDSRTVGAGELFWALRGESFDGNLYAEEAIERGAIGAVVDADSKIGKRAVENPEQYPEIFPVDDTLKALQDMGRYHRSKYNIPVIALTGTNGKTTTKELIRSGLATKYRVLATEGNLNNHIGVPLTLLQIDERTEIAVIEMGASAPKEIAALTAIALPNYGLITNVGKAHLLGFGSFAGVKRTKGELYDYLQLKGDTAFYNADNKELREMIEMRPDLKTIPYGVNYSGVEIMTATPDNPYLRLIMPSQKGDKIMISTQMVGDYNAENVMAALAVATHFGVEIEEAVKAIEDYLPQNKRSQLKEGKNGNLLVIDTYNANPVSMRLSLSNFDSIPFKNKVLILGDMRELGEDSLQEHVDILRFALKLGAERVILVGAEFKNAATSLEMEQERGDLELFPNIETLIEEFARNPLANKTIFIKGSNGIGLFKLDL